MFTAPVETIQAAANEESLATITHRPADRFLKIPLIPAVVLGVTLLAVAALFVSMKLIRMRSSAPPLATQTVRFRVPVPETLHLAGSGGFSLSPDGRTLA